VRAAGRVVRPERFFPLNLPSPAIGVRSLKNHPSLAINFSCFIDVINIKHFYLQIKAFRLQRDEPAERRSPESEDSGVSSMKAKRGCAILIDKFSSNQERNRGDGEKDGIRNICRRMLLVHG
jgi:hypothetical protein